MLRAANRYAYILVVEALLAYLFYLGSLQSGSEL
jgi:hypothetical protein